MIHMTDANRIDTRTYPTTCKSSLATWWFLVSARPTGCLSCLNSISLQVSFGFGTRTVSCRPLFTISDVQRATTLGFGLPLEISDGFRLYSSNDYEAQCMSVDAFHPGLMYPHGPPHVFARNSRIRYVDWLGDVYGVFCGSGMVTWFDLRAYLRCHLLLKHVPSNNFSLFQMTPAGPVKVGLTTSLPDIDKDSSAGFSHKFPILLRRTDLINTRIDGVDYTVSIAGCKTYLEVAKVIRKLRFPKATCAEQLVLYYASSNPLDLASNVPRYSLGDEKKVLHATIISDESPEELSTSNVTIASGTESCAQQVHKDQASADKISKQVETSETAIDHVDESVWDAVHQYQTESETRLIFVETRHTFTFEHVTETVAKFKKLLEGRNRGSKRYFDTPITLILVATVFEERAIRVALKLREVIKATNHRNDELRICYSNGSLYSDEGTMDQLSRLNISPNM